MGEVSFKGPRSEGDGRKEEGSFEGLWSDVIEFEGMVNIVEQEVVTTNDGLEVEMHWYKLDMTEGGGRAASKERRDEPKMKKPKKLKTPKKVKLPAGPFLLDEEKLMDKYNDSPNHIEIIKSLPRLDNDLELFKEVEDRINPCKNTKFLHSLHNGSDAKTTISAFQLTKEKYKEECGEEWSDPWKKSTSGATGGRGKDTMEMAVLKVKSQSWVRTVSTAFNYIKDFVEENPEFRCLDWTSATAEEYDVVLGYFWLWHAPTEGGNSLGRTRFTVDVLKQHKTAVSNLVTQVLKRTDIDVHSKAFSFSNNMYRMKRNLTASEPMEGNAGDRKRFAFTDEDKEKMDLWVTSPLHEVCILAYSVVCCCHPTLVCEVKPYLKWGYSVPNKL